MGLLFDESFEGTCEGEVRNSENGGYQHPYFTNPKKLNEEIGISRFSHVDMFSLRSRPQNVVQDIVNDPDSREFVEEQLRLFRTMLTYCPKLYFRINGVRGGG